jgi:hypothetical protein
MTGVICFTTRARHYVFQTKAPYRGRVRHAVFESPRRGVSAAILSDRTSGVLDRCGVTWNADTDAGALTVEDLRALADKWSVTGW